VGKYIVPSWVHHISCIPLGLEICLVLQQLTGTSTIWLEEIGCLATSRTPQCTIIAREYGGLSPPKAKNIMFELKGRWQQEEK
jgi:hypothetical protein